MPRHRRQRHVERFGEIAHRGSPCGEAREDRAAGGVGLAAMQIGQALGVSNAEARGVLFGLLGEADFSAAAIAAPSTSPGGKYGSMTEPPSEGSG